MQIRFDNFAGKKDFGDATSTTAPFLREVKNCDIDDQMKRVSRREGFSAVALAGAYHSLWSNRAETLAFGVLGNSLLQIHAGPTTTPMRSDLRSGLEMDYVEINNQVYYSNGEVLGFIEGGRNGSFPAIAKFGGSRTYPGQIIEEYNGFLLTALGGRIAYSEHLDFGRSAPRNRFLWLPGFITMMRAVRDGVYVSYGDKTIFLMGEKPSDFSIKEVADYPAIPRTAFKFDASLVSSNMPLQGEAVYWDSTQGPCIGYMGGQMINLALTKVVPTTGVAGASILRKNRKGFMQALTVIQK
jgi:hypothetical protein